MILLCLGKKRAVRTNLWTWIKSNAGNAGVVRLVDFSMNKRQQAIQTNDRKRTLSGKYPMKSSNRQRIVSKSPASLLKNEHREKIQKAPNRKTKRRTMQPWLSWHPAQGLISLLRIRPTKTSHKKQLFQQRTLTSFIPITGYWPHL